VKHTVHTSRTAPTSASSRNPPRAHLLGARHRRSHARQHGPRGRVGPTPWSQEDVLASREYKILTQFTSPKDINVTINRSLWLGVADLPEVVIGTLLSQGERLASALEMSQSKQARWLWHILQKTSSLSAGGILLDLSKRLLPLFSDIDPARVWIEAYNISSTVISLELFLSKSVGFIADTVVVFIQLWRPCLRPNMNCEAAAVNTWISDIGPQLFLYVPRGFGLQDDVRSV